MIKRIIRAHKRTFIKFCIIGGLATILNYAVFFMLYQFFNIHYLLSSATGYISGVFIGFILNKKITFKSKSPQYTPEAVKYLLVYTTSLFMGLGVLKSLVFLGTNVLLANVITIGFTTMTNYIGCKYFVFDNEYLTKNIEYLIYRYRYLSTYIAIGLSSIIVEVLIISLAKSVSSIIILNTILAFIIGMLFSFILNAKLNFKIPRERNLRTFYIFSIISTFAFTLNLILIKYIFPSFFITNYSITRFISAGCIFLISYTLHRKFTFIDVKEVGIAIYLSAAEDIAEIKNKVSIHPDWIHIDLVDKTFNPSAKEVDISKGYEIKHYWPKLKTMTHIMSKTPSKWIDKVAPYSDYLLIHSEIKEPIHESLTLIKQLGKKNGISILSNTDIESIKPYLKNVDVIQVLGIEKPGKSGQHMNQIALDKLNELNELKHRCKYKFDLCFDGGVKLSNINKLNAKYIVSGSSVLKSGDAKEAIHVLKTSSKYYYDHGGDLKNFLKTKIESILTNTDFVKSGTLVGSFAHGRGLEGISDIDIVVVVDKLTKNKFNKLVNEFEKLKPIITTDYNYDTIINTTFGPLKFNKDKTVVFHLMIYDINSHIDHCIKSPFTCLDWQTSEHHVKKSLADIWNVTALQPNNFFSARRSVKDYIRDLNSNSISYREYTFKGSKITETKKSKQMDNKDRFEFSYHIMKFCMTNLLKLYYHENKKYTLDELLQNYFNIFQKNRDRHSKYILKIKDMKDSNKFKPWRRENETALLSFLTDFENQFNNFFHNNASSIYFMRHEKTKMNKPNVFIGRHSNPDIILLKHTNLSKFFNEKNIKLIYSSPMNRCLQTISLFKEFNKKRITIDKDLQEIDYGKLDGKDYTYLKKKYPNLIKQWASRKDPKFPGGENSQDVLARVKDFLNNLKKDNVQGNHLICTHNVFLRCLVGHLFNIPMHKWHLIDIPHTEPLEVILAANGKFYLNLTLDQKDKLFKNVHFGND